MNETGELLVGLLVLAVFLLLVVLGIGALFGLGVYAAMQTVLWLL